MAGGGCRRTIWTSEPSQGTRVLCRTLELRAQGMAGRRTLPTLHLAPPKVPWHIWAAGKGHWWAGPRALRRPLATALPREPAVFSDFLGPLGAPIASGHLPLGPANPARRVPKPRGHSASWEALHSAAGRGGSEHTRGPEGWRRGQGPRPSQKMQLTTRALQAPAPPTQGHSEAWLLTSVLLEDAGGGRWAGTGGLAPGADALSCTSFSQRCPRVPQKSRHTLSRLQHPVPVTPGEHVSLAESKPEHPPSTVGQLQCGHRCVRPVADGGAPQ